MLPSALPMDFLTLLQLLRLSKLRGTAAVLDFIIQLIIQWFVYLCAECG